MEHTEFGRAGEDIALAYLEKKKMKLLDRNVRSAHGEIDLIMDDGGTVVFVEVKARQNRRYGDPIEAVTLRKKRFIRYTAKMYLTSRRIEDRHVRFDVVEIMAAPGRETKIRHVKNAF